MNIIDLIKKEGWEIRVQGKGAARKQTVVVYDEEFPITHPFAIHSKLYRTTKNPETKYFHLKSMHDYMWPEETWHSWTEDRFREFTCGSRIITLAGGASTTKSYDSAKYGLLFYLANPEQRGVIVASTTLDSLESRVWGYVKNMLSVSTIEFPLKYVKAKPPKVLFMKEREGSLSNIDDTVHGMFAIAAKRGDSFETISTWIGRHPKEALLLILDEATELPVAIMDAVPNLEAGGLDFQIIAIGNSNSKFDLHGALSTPKEGWSSVDPMRDTRWETSHKGGVCLFFSCYNSPVIHEQDPIKKAVLSRFLITPEQIAEKEKKYGKDSQLFWRFVLGFWMDEGADDTVFTHRFFEATNVEKMAEWSGLYPLSVCAALDPSFSQGGDQCILRFGILGHDTSGKIVLDFRHQQLMFPLDLLSKHQEAIEIQIADQVIAKLNEYGVSLGNLFIDANGQGRALGSVIKLRAQSPFSPMGVYSARIGVGKQKSFDLLVKPVYEMWTDFKALVQADQIRGLDAVTVEQLTSRLVEVKNGKPSIESKREYKIRMGAINPALAHSPDEADSAILVVQCAINRFGFTVGQKLDLQKVEELELKKRFDLQRNEMLKKPEIQIPTANFKSTIEQLAKFRRPF